MDKFRTRIVRAMRVGWGIFGLGCAAAVAALLLGGTNRLPLAVDFVAFAILIAFALNLTLLVILWRRGMHEHETAPVSIPAADAHEQPASM